MTRRAAPVPRRVADAMQARYRQALSRHGAGDLDAAEALYREILLRMPESFHALHMLGVLVGQRDDLEQSARLIEHAIRVDPSVAAAHANLGNTLRLLERGDDAMASYERALRLQPDNTRALKGRGLLLWKQRSVDAALACYERLLQLEPGYADGWIMQGAILNLMKRNDESIASYRRALEFDQLIGAEKIRYVLASMSGESVPQTSPLEYVRHLFDRYAGSFDHHLVQQLNYRVPELLTDRLRLLVPAERIDVLDLGCGTGLCGPLLEPWARTLTGLDVSGKMLDEARRKHLYDTLVAGEIGAWLPTQHERFDLVVAADVFIYIGDLEPVFAAVHGALRPDGLFAFSTEASEDADTRLLESLRYAHSAAYLQRLASAGGWVVESIARQVLREEENQEVGGHLTVLRRPR